MSNQQLRSAPYAYAKQSRWRGFQLPRLLTRAAAGQGHALDAHGGGGAHSLHGVCLRGDGERLRRFGAVCEACLAQKVAICLASSTSKPCESCCRAAIMPKVNMICQRGLLCFQICFHAYFHGGERRRAS